MKTNRTLFLALLLGVSCGLTACGDEDDSTTADSTSNATTSNATTSNATTGATSNATTGATSNSTTGGTTGGTTTTPAVTHTVGLRLVSFLDGTPLEGARVCLNDSQDCVSSAPDGSLEITNYPDRAEAFITIDVEGYMPTIIPFWLTDDIALSWGLVPDSIVSVMEGAIDDMFEPETSYLSMRSFDLGTNRGAVGSTFTTVPEGVGPFYFSAMGLPDPSLVGTTTDGNAGWLDLPAMGTGEVSVQPSDGMECARNDLAWPHADLLTTTFPMRAGYLTIPFPFLCVETNASVGFEHEGYLANTAPSRCLEDYDGGLVYPFDEEDGWWSAVRLTTDDGRETSVDQIEYMLADSVVDGADQFGCALLDHRVQIFVGFDSPAAEPTILWEADVTGLERSEEDGLPVRVTLDIPPTTLPAGQSLYIMVETPVDVGTGDRVCMATCPVPNIEDNRNYQTGSPEPPYSWPTLRSFGITNLTHAAWARVAE